MNENLIQSISDYAKALEQQFAALEQRIAFLEQQAAATDQQLTAAEQRIASLEQTLEVEKASRESTNLQLVAFGEQLAIALSDRNQNDDTIAELGQRLAQLEAEVADELVDYTPDTEEEDIENIDDTIQVQEPAPTIVAAPQPVAQPEPEPVIEPEPVKEPEPAPQPVVEQPTEEVAEPQPVSQPAAQPVAQPKSSVVFGSPVADIRKAISIGDRFLFQRELFGQNVELMQRTLGEINDQPSFDDALQYIQTNFNWDKESQAYELFINILHRRFG